MSGGRIGSGDPPAAANGRAVPLGAMFEVEVTGRRLRWEGDRWSTSSDAALAELVNTAPARPHALTRPSPILDVDWSYEPWVWLHTLDALELLGAGVEVITAPDVPTVPDVPPRAIP